MSYLQPGRSTTSRQPRARFRCNFHKSTLRPYGRDDLKLPDVRRIIPYSRSENPRSSSLSCICTQRNVQCALLLLHAHCASSLYEHFPTWRPRQAGRCSACTDLMCAG
ncbi:hypothetical protein CERSUDRAFT_114637 [Gelatoporia subvermispora B]|uniref:Uncharacterized protein n=1 Tax=Ceriporiopsis subvermispora (strain B) TaxID=914234 RepID=M2RCZ1_CERS8|nr:hypothetical protein CERSUDRAFT_114637 [Gelatoporia subvermispora B]